MHGQHCIRNVESGPKKIALASHDFSMPIVLPTLLVTITKYFGVCSKGLRTWKYSVHFALVTSIIM